MGTAWSGDTVAFVLELYRKALSLQKNDLYEYFLEHAVHITQSEIGFFHLVKETQKIIVLTSWNKKALENCRANYETHYPIEKAGNWADSIRLKRPLIFNDFEASPNQMGLPSGHVKINRLLSFPVIDNDRVIAIYGVGNKQGEYSKQDIIQLDLISSELCKILKQRQAEEALRESEERLKLKLDSVLSPDVEVVGEDLEHILDTKSMQDMMNYLYAVTNMGFALIDLNGNVLVSTGWQDLCTKFHRINERSLKNCIESDLQLTTGLKKGEIRLYKCKNNMWDIVTPLFIAEKHMGNLFFGQFFFEEESVDKPLFALQAEKYGFNKKDYLRAYENIPRFSHEKVENLMIFYSKLAEIISKISYANLKLANALSDQKILQQRLEEKANEVTEYALQMEELAKQRLHKLKDAERLAGIGATAAMVGHDIRNPLQAIISDLYFAKKDLNKLTGQNIDNINENLSSIDSSVNYINKIVQDLQDYAKPIKLTIEETDLKALCYDVLKRVNTPASIIKECKVNENSATISTDQYILRRILTNLLNNAIQAMPNGGKVTLGAQQVKGKVVIAVTDTGIGIPREIKDRIFTPLFTTKSKGQGFGLAVVKRMTETSGGTVAFESEESKGTKFIIEIPVKRTSDQNL